ncbi:glycosyltransferase [Rhodococcus opacus]|uniref:Putative glycosyltransferase n=1 Tax=Rhodococcus opacus (strain B4) TaxID=632772 RepID=C1AWI3_RHOOB|nr:glycosyltransferase [Rhodococcus opacus]BAH53756.1 putative glycosyltransferase [Rhodococcus opacus B4]
MNILLTVGTHEQPFQRLISAIEEIIDSDRPNYCWKVQYGIGSFQERDGVESVPYFSSNEIAARFEWADIVISQASPGIVFNALERNAWPLVIGRQKQYGEHVDDHQLDFATLADKNGWATEIKLTSDIAGQILKCSENVGEYHDRCIAAMRRSHNNTIAFRNRFWSATLTEIA